jgi:hypothetical protein
MPASRVIKSIEEESRPRIQGVTADCMMSFLGPRLSVTLDQLLDERLYPADHFVEIRGTSFGENLRSYRKRILKMDRRALSQHLGLGKSGEGRLGDLEETLVPRLPRREALELLAALNENEDLTLERMLSGPLFPVGDGLRRGRLSILILILLVLLLALRPLWMRFAPVTHTIGARQVVAVDRTLGFERWRLSTRATITDWGFGPWTGSAEALILTLGNDDPGDGSSVYVLDARSGRTLMHNTIDLEDLAAVYRREEMLGTLAAGPFLLEDLDDDGANELAVLYRGRNDPSALRLFDDDGRVLGTYHHSGHLGFLRSADLNGDGRRELLVGGANAARAGCTVILLDPARVNGVAAVSESELERLRPGAEGDSSLYRFILPGLPPERMTLFGERCFGTPAIGIDRGRDGRPLLRVEMGAGREGNADSPFRVLLDEQLRPSTCNGLPLSPGDNFRPIFARWLREGSIDFSFADPTYLRNWLNRHDRLVDGQPIYP